MFWHIDYLLADKNVSVKAIIAAETTKKLECQINSYLKNTLEAKILAKGFGASDCKNGCGSHLLYFSENCETEKLIEKLGGHLESLQDVLSVIVIS